MVSMATRLTWSTRVTLRRAVSALRAAHDDAGYPMFIDWYALFAVHYFAVAVRGHGRHPLASGTAGISLLGAGAAR